MGSNARVKGKRERRLTVLIAAGVSLAGCGQFELPGDDDSAPAGTGTEAASYPVVGGTLSPVCGVPMNVKIPGCTATLLTSTILVTAKHCGPKAGMNVEFGEKAPFAFSVKAVKCVSAKDSDTAYCVLPDDERLKRVPTVPVLHGCEYTKYMKAGAVILGAGFGQTKGTGPARTKSTVDVPVARVRDPYIDTGDKTHDLCFGDSGGGAFIHLVEGDKDWGWRLIGTVTGTARGVMAPCGGTNFTTILRHIKLIEENEKIDITPCTDAQGAWAPGPNCKDFLTDIKTGGGAWPTCNAGPTTSVAIDSCGGGAGPAPTPGGPPPVSAGGDAGAGGASGAPKPDASADAGSNAGGASGGGATGGRPGAGNPSDASAGGNTGGSAGAGRSGGAGGSAGAGGTGGAPDNSGASNKSVSGGCDIASAGSGRTGAWPLALLGLVLLRTRRRRLA